MTILSMLPPAVMYIAPLDESAAASPAINLHPLAAMFLIILCILLIGICLHLLFLDREHRERDVAWYGREI